MQYREFLRLTGATEEECRYGAYQKLIEPAYMNNDDIFPTKAEVVDYWHKFGLLGFSTDAIARLRQAIDAVRSLSSYTSGYLTIANPEDILEIIGRAATTAH